jgi:hypothetical protein
MSYRRHFEVTKRTRGVSTRIVSRRIVGWRIADADSADLAAELITRACRDGNVDLFIAAIRSHARIDRRSETRSWIKVAVVVKPVDRSCEV